MPEPIIRVLIVEDTGHWLALLQARLADMECEVLVARDLEEGRALLDQGPYHLAIVDVRLQEGDIDDISGLRLIREAWERRRIRNFVVLSGYPVEERVQAHLGGDIPYRLFDKSDVVGEHLEEYIREKIQEAGQHDI